ncbi:MAG: NAD(P)/FAD-dependent oxidoreductase [Pikeienuella sp.]|uniref:NAD(P)/FAD-dependent oxidoreductase n=1 Tax=Pikeienuella sp. TaxID=2831957 RepID=UPI00391AF1B0
MRVIVIGAGIIGAAFAHALARKGASVTVVEAARPAGGATAKSFGWINANYVQTPAYLRLRLDALEAWRRAAPVIGPALRWGGSLAWEAGGAELQAQAEGIAAAGHEARLIGREEFARLEPDVADPPELCLHCPTEGAADPVAATEALLAAAVALGAERMVGCRALGFLTEGGLIAGVETDFGPLPADRVVVAAGVGSEALLESAGVRLPMENRVGLILHTRPLPPVLRHLVLTPEIHFRQEADGRIVAGELYSGGGAHEGMIDREPRALAALMLETLRRRLPGVAGVEQGAVMLGLRPTPADGLPILGPARGAEGLYLATTHSGVTLAPLLGEIGAAEIVDGEEDARLAPFRLARFN